ncbi:MAG: transcriptional regulator GcvA [Gammaproteobacteria bacterium]|nr:transcriptional regulator GcvA [Gammaproteobacteria bacterium]NIM74507.1 transcriptional regulator GcvA [Gammaproteobacteria bacterium]NIO26340.1 transcriptional regulator GcvA [Gammaproteobacteria bacterium]NIO66892.1 transcriptional regulator GcvA [Gammaproteobacteria bacterium]NIP45200.1 transcriptional regulator GcvA [Gammaproteobacteria bacterium]
MQRNLPPLNALRAFEAAARHLSITRAAEELHVTPAAVSHQVKGLEAYLGLALFKRANRSLRLTDAGQACLPGLREGFERLAAAMDALRAGDESGPLTVSVPPSFGAKWLVARLDRFRQANPGYDVRLDASMRLVDLAREGVDIAVRYGAGRYPGMRVDRLMDEVAVPVCSPRLLEGAAPLRVPADLCRHTLLHHTAPYQDHGYPDWRMWLQAAGVDGCDLSRGPTFSMASLAVQAAIDGQGVALVGDVLVADDIAAGRLVRPFALSFPVSFAYYVVCPLASAERPRVVAFREWLLEEARNSAARSAAA